MLFSHIRDDNRLTVAVSIETRNHALQHRYELAVSGVQWMTTIESELQSACGG